MTDERRKQIEEAAENSPSSDGTSSFSNGFILGAEFADSNPTTEEQHRRFLMDRKLYKQLLSDRKILVEALKHYRGLEFGETANDALKAIGEME